MSAEKPRISILEQRRIEAGVIKPIYETLEAELGTARARQLIGAAIRKAAREGAQQLAQEAAGVTNLETFAALLDRWKEGNAYDMEVLAQNAEHFDFNIRRCSYAEMYKDMGLGHIGHLLSCQRDGALCEGYDPKIRMRRTQTIMEGASHCDFRFSYDGDGDFERRTDAAEDEPEGRK
jgi:hypothetical protein